MSKLKKISVVLILAIIFILSISNNVAAVGGSHWYDWNNNGDVMNMDIKDLADQFCGSKLSAGGEGPAANFPANVGCIHSPTTGAWKDDGFGAGVIDITRRHR